MHAVSYEKRADEALQRSNVYGFLSVVYAREISADFLEHILSPPIIECISELGINWHVDDNGGDNKKRLEDLAVEYARLFLGPGKHISPHESVHHDTADAKGGMLWGDATVNVISFIKSLGFDYEETYSGIPDHISVELELMQKIILHEEKAWRDTDVEMADYCRMISKKFIEEHLTKWVPAFCDKVMQETSSSFYKGVADLTKRFIEIEKEEVAISNH